ncbi:MAG: hypothetical protein KAJ19_18565 [Gammaproteobacteria bacterium]|nr:hypothetical protein [Gammaproteobacteria bacterium]
MQITYRVVCPYCRLKFSRSADIKAVGLDPIAISKVHTCNAPTGDMDKARAGFRDGCGKEFVARIVLMFEVTTCRIESQKNEQKESKP